MKTFFIMPHTLKWTKIWAPVTVSRTTWTHTEFPSRLQSVNMCVKFRNKVCTTSNYLPTTISDHLHPLPPHDLIHLNSVLHIIITYNGHLMSVYILSTLDSVARSVQYQFVLIHPTDENKSIAKFILETGNSTVKTRLNMNLETNKFRRIRLVRIRVT